MNDFQIIISCVLFACITISLVFLQFQAPPHLRPTSMVRSTASRLVDLFKRANSGAQAARQRHKEAVANRPTPAPRPIRVATKDSMGCFLEILAILAGLVGVMVCVVMLPVGALILLVALGLLVVGHEKHYRIACSQCRNTLPDKTVSICPACGAAFR